MRLLCSMKMEAVGPSGFNSIDLSENIYFSPQLGKSRGGVFIMFWFFLILPPKK